MKTIPFAIALLAALALAPAAAGSGTVTVTLEVGEIYHLLPAEKTCDVQVAAGANAGDVLDAAVATGCISSWDYASFGSERYVTCVDGECEGNGNYWFFYENGVQTSYGIDAAESDEGDVFTFTLSPLAVFVLP